MILSRYTIKNINSYSVIVPQDGLFHLPEKVLQFGTGALLRGLADYFIDKANRNGIFNGRIVVVKSTSHGELSAFEKQDGLYTLCIRGFQNGAKVEENIINSSISRVLNAAAQWEQVLECAHNHQIQVIISNTTEVGIQLIADDIHCHPPKSFPGKLLAFLYERYRAFGGSAHSGMVIIPTELIPENGKRLEAIVLELAHLNGLEEAFMEWVEKYNHFCSSLVDRIVPGKPNEHLQLQMEEGFGYSDQLLTMSESYRLWAIEGDENVKNLISFAKTDDGIIIKPDIEIYRELKLRLLNGTHTLSSGLCVLAGLKSVKEAMDDETIASYITNLMLNEIAPSIPFEISLTTAHDFGRQVLDRFRNPHIEHLWLNITLQYSSKMKMRCIPLLLKHYQTHTTPPELFTLGFAAYLRFMQSIKKIGEQYFGVHNGENYLIQDDRAEVFYKRSNLCTKDFVLEVLSDVSFWEEDLSELPGFAVAVTEALNLIQASGVKNAIEAAQSRMVIPV